MIPLQSRFLPTIICRGLKFWDLLLKYTYLRKFQICSSKFVHIDLISMLINIFFVMTVWQNNTECLSLGNLMLVGLELTNTVCRSPFSQSLEKDKPWTSGQTLKLISSLYLWRRKIFKHRHLQNITEVDQHMRCPFRPAGDVQAGCNHMGVLPASKNEQRKVVGSGFTHRH
jgi:hypothetical protein